VLQVTPEDDGTPRGTRVTAIADVEQGGEARLNIAPSCSSGVSGYAPFTRCKTRPARAERSARRKERDIACSATCLSVISTVHITRYFDAIYRVACHAARYDMLTPLVAGAERQKAAYAFAGRRQKGERGAAEAIILRR